MKVKSIAMIVLLALGAFACEFEKIQPPEDQDLASPMDAYMGDEMSAKKGADVALSITPEFLDEINSVLASKEKDYRVLMAETLTAAGSDEMGITVVAKNVGNKQFGEDFVAGDLRRPWSSDGGNAITYAIDQTADAVPPSGGLTAAQTDAAIERGVMTWDDVRNTDLGLTRNPDGGLDIGAVAWQVSGGLVGSPFVFADIQHAGFRDLDFVGGVLGVTFTYIFVEGANIPTDIDNNGKADVAFREIYYDPTWEWKDDGVTNIDVESVAVHEFGHGLSQGHFGFVFVTKKGDLKFSPFAIMNAVYAKPATELQPTDLAGHSSIWANWPNN